MDEYISRQAAIDALGDEPLVWTEGEYALGSRNQWQSDVDALRTLPSAQPEKRTEERTKTHACDCIERQAAIDVMCELMHHWFGSDTKDEIREIKRELEKLPSAEPEIIRCKDCKHNQCKSASGNALCELFYGMTDQMGYCHMAERRTDERA